MEAVAAWDFWDPPAGLLAIYAAQMLGDAGARCSALQQWNRLRSVIHS